ncbi:LANO_0B07404g1_1 [Lachancea nothofagi CBS 11611]|uniref:LANO_0B07404g1_1 n=1 Tax=Lachancea nothofagi CBS 11611 TaxID=1266666 RepID=A0A1G4IZN2_9SACH|nr:LANO_0B07404g1_1 [Lachancea nothofagi CBS 11611]
MSELPVTSQDLKSRYSQHELPTVLRRLFKSHKNLDFESAIWEMVNLIFRPRKAHRSLYYQRQTRNRWSRDDPSFFILQIGLLSASSMVWSIVYGHSFLGFIKMMINMILVDFFAFGFAVATLFWALLNRSFFKFKSVQNSQVEWAYCFDVHCNAFLVVWSLLYLLQFLLLPVINLHRWIGLFIGNTLYCAAFGQYFVLSFYGYSQLPILKNVNFILLPTLVFAAIYVVSLFGLDLSTVFSFHTY